MSEPPSVLLLALQAFNRGERAAARDLAASLAPEAPGHATAQRLLSLLAYQDGSFPLAADHARRAVAGGDAVAHELLAAALMKCGQPAAAVPSFRAALAQAGPAGAAPQQQAPQQQAQAEYNLAMALLAAEQWAEGWQRFEARWRVKPIPSWVRPWERFWDGSPLAGRHLLAHAEQGFGDTLQFLRYLLPLRDRGERITLAVPPPLARLLRAGLPGIAVISKGDPLPAWDVHVPLMSLPRLFASTPDSVPAAPSYLTWPAARRWSGPGPAVGLVWAGNRHDPDDRYRSLPPGMLAGLLAELQARGTVASLQHDGEDLLDRLPAAADVVRLGSGLRDFADTAAAMMGLDLVVTVDTAAAHLAGALGRPTWLLLARGGDWRWLADGETSPWYPSLRLFRQPAAGDWRAVLLAVTAALDGSGDLTRPG